MAALTHQQWYDQVLEAVQLLSTNNPDGTRRDTVSVTTDGMSVSYSASQLRELEKLLDKIANKINNRNRRKRVIPGFDYV